MGRPAQAFLEGEEVFGGQLVQCRAERRAACWQAHLLWCPVWQHLKQKCKSDVLTGSGYLFISLNSTLRLINLHSLPIEVALWTVCDVLNSYPGFGQHFSTPQRTWWEASIVAAIVAAIGLPAQVSLSTAPRVLYPWPGGLQMRRSSWHSHQNWEILLSEIEAKMSH